MIPSKKELMTLILNGNDSQNNSLILTLDGHFELRKFSQELKNDKTIAARNETFGANNGYVGEKAGRDRVFIDNIYKQLLEMWIVFLRTRTTNNYTDTTITTSTEEKLIGEINSLL